MMYALFRPFCWKFEFFENLKKKLALSNSRPLSSKHYNYLDFNIIKLSFSFTSVLWNNLCRLGVRVIRRKWKRFFSVFIKVTVIMGETNFISMYVSCSDVEKLGVGPTAEKESLTSGHNCVFSFRGGWTGKRLYLC